MPEIDIDPREPVPAYIRHSWRWNSLDALRYDYEMAIGKRNSARMVRGIAGAIDGISGSSAVADRYGRLPAPLKRFATQATAAGRAVRHPLVWAGAAAVGATAGLEEAYFAEMARRINARIQLLSGPPQGAR